MVRTDCAWPNAAVARKKAGMAGKRRLSAILPRGRMVILFYLIYFGASLKTQTEPPCSR